MIAIYAHCGAQVKTAQIRDWTKRETAPDFEETSDENLALFLNGLIIERRGRKDGPLPEAEKKLNNNIILRSWEKKNAISQFFQLAFFIVRGLRTRGIAEAKSLLFCIVFL